MRKHAVSFSKKIFKRSHQFFKRSAHKIKQYKIAAILPALFLLLGAVWFSTYAPVEEEVHRAELQYAEYSPLGVEGGSVVPASCESNPHFAGECDTGIPAPSRPNVALTCVNGTASVTWNSPGATYVLTRFKDKDTGYQWPDDNNRNPASQPLTYSGLSGSRYEAWVHSCNAGGCSDAGWSGEVSCARPNPPTVGLTCSNGTASVTWNSPGATSVNVRFRDINTGNLWQDDGHNPAAQPWLIGPGLGGTRYDAWVHSCNANGCSAAQNSGEVSCAPETTWYPYCTGGDPNYYWQWWESNHPDPTQSTVSRYLRPGDGTCTPPPARPNPPTVGLTCTNGTANVTWNGPGATYMSTYFQDINTGYIWQDNNRAPTNQPWSHSGLSGARYKAWVHSCNAGGCSNAAITGEVSCATSTLDVCPNIPGDQATVPSDYERPGGTGNCILRSVSNLAASCVNNTATMSWNTSVGTTYAKWYMHDNAYPWSGCGTAGNWCGDIGDPQTSVSGLSGTYSWGVGACGNNGCSSTVAGQEFSCLTAACPSGQVRNSSGVCVNQPRPPHGWQDASSCSALVGWACDPDNYATPLSVLIYKDGVYLGSATANQTNANAGAGCGGNNSHGYSYPLPAGDGINHSYTVYAVDDGTNGNATNSLLEGGPTNLTCSVPPGTPTQPTNPIGSCVGTSGNFSWTAGSGNTSYDVRINKRTSPSDWDPDCTAPIGSGDYCVNGYTGGTNFPFTGVVGATYSAWVHGRNGSVVSEGVSAQDFTCPATNWTTYCTNGGGANPWEWWQYTDDTSPRTFRFLRDGDGSCVPPASPSANLEIRLRTPQGSWSNSLTIDVGQDIDLKWSSTNAVNCFGTEFTTGAGNPRSGQTNTDAVSEPGLGTRTYAVTCENSSGVQASDSVVLTVVSSLPAPTLTVNPSQVQKNATTVVSGDLKGHTGCTINGANINGNSDTYSGFAGTGTYSRTTGPVLGETTFELTCSSWPGAPVKGKVSIKPLEIEI